MRGELADDIRLLGVALDDVPEGLARHAVATARGKQVFGLALEQDLHPRPGHELAQPALRLLAERDEPLAVALAAHAQHALVEVDLALAQVDELGDAQA